MNPTKVVVNEMQGNSVAMVFDLLTESIGKAGNER
jgi:hypothetical protein